MSVGWNFYMKKINWAVNEKKFPIDNYPICYQYYDSMQDRQFPEYDFLLHKYASLPSGKPEKEKFMEFWKESKEKGKKTLFVDDLAYTPQTNSRDYFIEKTNEMMLSSQGLIDDLKAYQEKLGLEQKFLIKCPKSVYAEQKDYPEMPKFLKENNMHLPVQLKSGNANFHDLFLVFNPEVQHKLCDEMHQDGKKIMVQEIIPHKSIIYKVYYFCEGIDTDKRYSLPSDLTFEKYV